jgi:hypothetical protein
MRYLNFRQAKEALVNLVRNLYSTKDVNGGANLEIYKKEKNAYIKEKEGFWDAVKRALSTNLLGSLAFDVLSYYQRLLWQMYKPETLLVEEESGLMAVFFPIFTVVGTLISSPLLFLRGYLPARRQFSKDLWYGLLTCAPSMFCLCYSSMPPGPAFMGALHFSLLFPLLGSATKAAGRKIKGLVKSLYSYVVTRGKTK